MDRCPAPWRTRLRPRSKHSSHLWPTNITFALHSCPSPRMPAAPAKLGKGLDGRGCAYMLGGHHMGPLVFLYLSNPAMDIE